MRITQELREWQSLHGVSDAAVKHLMHIFGVSPPPPITPGVDPSSEAAVQSDIRVETSKAGWRLWRNNVGVLMDDRGIPVRYGLANETKAMNQKVKSSDLIGIRPVLIEQHHVGTTIGQFVAIEVKKQDWKFAGNNHEKAQLKFIEIVNSLGGYGKFANSVDMVF